MHQPRGGGARKTNDVRKHNRTRCALIQRFVKWLTSLREKKTCYDSIASRGNCQYKHLRSYHGLSLHCSVYELNIYSLHDGLRWLETGFESRSGRMFVIKVVHAYTVFQAVQRPVVCIVVYGTVHYKESIWSFDKSSRVVHYCAESGVYFE